jgi:hypothetical protein
MNGLGLYSFRFLVDHAVGLAKQHLRELLLPVALPVIAVSIVSGLLQIRWLTLLQGGDSTASELALGTGLLFLMLVLVLGAFSLMYNALLVCSVDALAGRPVLLSRGLKKVLEPAIFGTTVVVGLVSFVSVLFCIFPALLVVPMVTFVVPAMIDEGKRGREAWRRSFELVWHNPTGRWVDSGLAQTLGFLIVGFLISSAASLAVQWPFIVMQQVLTFREVASGQMDAAEMIASTAWLQIPLQILGGLVTAAMWLYWTFGVALLFRELRRRKEGQDLEQAIDELTGASASE